MTDIVSIITAPAVTAAIQAHAVACYPNECCGAVTAAGYVPMENRHSDPRHFFDCSDQIVPLILDGSLLALAHSHPDGTAKPGPPDGEDWTVPGDALADGPSAFDMVQQAAMGVPWGLCMANAEVASPPFWWGDMLPIPPLEGREFRHGPSGTDGRGDCGALIRDFFRLRGIVLPEVVRDDRWWLAGGDIYRENYEARGFHAVPGDNPQPGDVVLMQIKSKVPNHAALYVGGGLIMHHLSARLSRREPLIRWVSMAAGWYRHESLR